MTIQGSASAAGTSIAIPTHQPGDLIIIFTMGTAAAPSVPAKSTTIPPWVITGSSAFANSLGSTVVSCVAQRSDHTSGTFTNATQIAVLVIRGTSTTNVTVGSAPAPGNANNTQTVVYPALTRQKTDGSSLGVRFGCRTVAVTAINTPPSGWTNRLVQPAGASALMAVHTIASLASNPTADSVSVTGTNAPYRAHTIEVREDPAPTPLDTTLIDDFNRADGMITDGAGAAIWNPTENIAGSAGSPTTSLAVLTNTVGLPATGGSFLGAMLLKRMARDFDLTVDCVTPPGSSALNAMMFYFCAEDISLAGSSWDGYSAGHFDSGTWRIQRFLNANPTTIATVSDTLPVAGETFWLAKRGSTLSFYRKPSGGAYRLVVQATDSTYDRAGLAEFRVGDDRNARWDNVRGGPYLVLPKMVAVT